MATQRYPAVLHQGATSQQIEVSLDAQALTLHISGAKTLWPYAQTAYRSGGIPRFEHADSLLIVADHAIVKAIDALTPEALPDMESRAGGMFTAGDFLTGLKAVLIVMAAAAALAAIIWYLRK
jgi:hypothetical protein